MNMNEFLAICCLINLIMAGYVLIKDARDRRAALRDLERVQRWRREAEERSFL